MNLMRRATKNFPTTLAGRAIAKSNRRKWLRAVAVLGDKWLLAQKVERKVEQKIERRVA